MRRRLLALTGALTLTVGLVAVPATVVSAAEGLEATSVALSASADCSSSANLDVGMTVAVDTNSETGTVTNLEGDVLSQFDQDGNWNGTDEVYTDYGNSIEVEQPEGTIIGSYASVGSEPLTSDSAIEWFVLYRCGERGQSTVLDSCYGDYGTCPQTAAEGVAAAFGGTVTPSTVEAGGTVAIDGEGCFFPLAGAVLVRDGLGIGVGDVVEPTDGGSFFIELGVPADLPSGPLDVQIDCGFDGETVVSDTVTVEVLGEIAPTTTTTAPTTTTTTSTTAASGPAPAVVTPRFTG
jgi:hypothetical protein